MEIAHARLQDTATVATISNVCKWQSVEPTAGHTDASGCKQDLDTLNKYGVDWHAHNLVRSISCAMRTTDD